MIWRYSVVFFLVHCLPSFVSAIEELSLFGADWTLELANGEHIHIPNCSLPSDVYLELYKKNLILNPYRRDNDEKYRWISKSSWSFSKQFTPTFSTPYKNFALLINGADTVASVWLNQKLIGNVSNMFRDYRFPLDGLLATLNDIRVHFESPVLYAAQQYAAHIARKGYYVPPECPPFVQHGECHVNHIRKMQASFSWDWGPAFPTVGFAGLSSALTLIGYNTCFTKSLSALVTRAKVWSVTVELSVECAVDFGRPGESVSLQVTLPDLPGVDQRKRVLGGLRAGSNLLRTVLEVSSEPQLWWPNGLGAQQLYEVYAKLVLAAEAPRGFSFAAETEILMERTRVGFRTVELVQEEVGGVEKGLTFYFRVNGVPTFLKGANWIPADSFVERITCAKIGGFFEAMQLANMNALRVWGGGMYESDCFYTEADRRGILIWQDFMFAVALYPALPSFLADVALEVRGQLRRLKSHPSILIWAGNNENEEALAAAWFHSNGTNEELRSDYLRLYKETIGPIVKEEDPTRPFVLSSPSNGKRTLDEGGIAKNPQSNLYGDVHFYSYTADSWQVATYPRARCVTEYGYQSLPSMQTLRTAMDANELEYFGAQMQHRQHHASGEVEMLVQVLSHFRLPDECEFAEILRANGLSYLAARRTTPSGASLLTPVAPREDAFDGLGRLNHCYKHELFVSNETQARFLKILVYLTQIQQAMAIKTETEAYRRGQGILDERTGEGLTMCALYWQLNDIWQAPTWSSIEFGGRWKALHYFATRFFSPVLVSPFLTTDTSGRTLLHVYVISDRRDALTNTTLIIDVLKWDSFTPVVSKRIPVAVIRPLNSTRVFEASVDDVLATSEYSPRDMVYNFRLVDGSDGELSPNNVLFGAESKLYNVPVEYFGTVSIVSVTLAADESAGFVMKKKRRRSTTQEPADSVTQLPPTVSSFLGVKPRWKKSFMIELEATAIAPFVWLEMEAETRPIKGVFGDNGFTMLTERVRVEFFAFDASVDLPMVRQQLRVMTLADIYAPKRSNM